MTAPDPTATVHRLAAEQALAVGHRLLDGRPLEAACAAAGVDHDAFIASLQDLSAAGTVNVRIFGSSVNILRITEEGLAQHLAATRGDLDAVRARIRAALQVEADGGRLGQPLDLASLLDEPYLLVETVLDDLRDRGELVFTPLTGGRVRLHRVGPPPLRAP